MVRIASFAVTITAALCGAGLVAAKSCRVGGIYCGRYLIENGDYTKKISVNLRANGHSANDYNNMQNSLFWACIQHGDIQFVELCDVGCHGGDRADDYCYAK